jgi:putative oxidoreductase
MNAIHTMQAGVSRAGEWLLPTLGRLVFAGVLFGYFWASAMTKLDGPFTPSLGAYAQIFPKAFEAVGFDVGQMGLWHRLVVLAGTWAEFALPVLIVLGLLTRLAALGMVGFIVVQSLTDIVGHGAAAGAWFDRASDALILDQRAFWVFLLAVLVLKGPGPFSADRFLGVERVRLAA